jgi:hypothetical protein
MASLPHVAWGAGASGCAIRSQHGTSDALSLVGEARDWVPAGMGQELSSPLVTTVSWAGLRPFESWECCGDCGTNRQENRA